MSTMGLVGVRCGCLGIVGYIKVGLVHVSLLVPWLTPLEFWAPQQCAVGENVCKSEGIVAITLAVITVKRLVYPLFTHRDEVP